MRHLLLGLALIAAPLALSACAGVHHGAGSKDWKKEALANCQKQTDPISRQTCLDEITAVEHERNKIP